MTAHILAIRADKGDVLLDVMCEGDSTAACHQECVKGCESFIIDDHEHKVRGREECNAVEWFDNVGVEVSCDPCGLLPPLSDGMRVEVEYIHGWVWRPMEAP